MYSLIVSIYKVEKYLRQCIDSILAQTYQDFELILVDDGSPDSCPQICDEYAAKDSRVKVIHKENGGLMSTRKVGVAAARGEYVCFVDGDDFISPDMLQTYESILKENSADIICGGYTACYADRTTQVKQKIPAGLYDAKSLRETVYPQMLSTAPFFSFYVIPSVCTKCFKRETAEAAYRDMPEAISLGEDAAASYPALLSADAIYIADYYGYMYRQNQASMTHTYDRNLYTKIKNLIEHLKNRQKLLGWDAGQQIDEYAVYLLCLARNNELIYNKDASYREKKNNLLKYLQDELFSAAAKNVRIKGMKNGFMLACFKYKLVFPLYLYNLIRG